MSLSVDDEARKLLIEAAIKAFPENISKISFIQQMHEKNYELTAMVYKGKVYDASQLRQLLEDVKEQDVKEPFDIHSDAYYQLIILFPIIDFIFSYQGEDIVPGFIDSYFGSAVRRERGKQYVLSTHLAFISYDDFGKSKVGLYDANHRFYDLSEDKSIPKTLKELIFFN